MDNPTLIIPYRKWKHYEQPYLKADANREIWDDKTCSAVERPRYVIPTKFDINSICLSVDVVFWTHGQ